MSNFKIFQLFLLWTIYVGLSSSLDKHSNLSKKTCFFQGNEKQNCNNLNEFSFLNLRKVRSSNNELPVGGRGQYLRGTSTRRETGQREGIWVERRTNEFSEDLQRGINPQMASRGNIGTLRGANWRGRNYNWRGGRSNFGSGWNSNRMEYVNQGGIGSERDRWQSNQRSGTHRKVKNEVNLKQKDGERKDQREGSVEAKIEGVQLKDNVKGFEKQKRGVRMEWRRIEHGDNKGKTSSSVQNPSVFAGTSELINSSKEEKQQIQTLDSAVEPLELEKQKNQNLDNKIIQKGKGKGNWRGKGSQRNNNKSEGSSKTELEPSEPKNQKEDENELKKQLFGSLINEEIKNYDKQIVVKINTKIPPITQLKSLNPLLMENIKMLNYSKTTPLQEYVIPTIFSRKDLLVSGDMGFGRIASYLIPLINIIHDGLHRQLEPNRLSKSTIENTSISQDQDERKVYPLVIILTPNQKELDKIYLEARRLTYLSSINVTNGADHLENLEKIQRGSNILVLTPSKLLLLLKRNNIGLEGCKFLILDGFCKLESEIEQIINPKWKLPTKSVRVTAIFSPEPFNKLKDLADNLLNRDYVILLAQRNIIEENIKNISIEFVNVPDLNKLDELKSIFTEKKIWRDNKANILIFVNDQIQGEHIKSQLEKGSYNCALLNDEINEFEKQQIIEDFQIRKYRFLILNSQTLRNINLDVAFVINYDMPNNIEEYEKQIQNVGNNGIVISFFNKTNSEITNDLIKMLKQNNYKIEDWLLNDDFE